MKFYFHKLGCPKNDVDGDYIIAKLVALGHEPVSTPEEADSVIVNTCGFILPAREESINEILRLGQLKQEGRIKTIYATGCLSQRSGEELLSGMPELDGAFGLGVFDDIAAVVGNAESKSSVLRDESESLIYIDGEQRYVGDDLPYAYLKISDGCDRRCTYCAIPSIRGHYRSRPVDSIVKEAEFLASRGKKELILVSQEATQYGRDLKNGPNIIELLQTLGQVDGVAWLRLMYLHPAEVDEKLIDFVINDTRTLSYFDLPLQHINDEILGKMRRRVTREQIERQIERIRAGSSEAAIRTVFIVGFPGETEKHFEELRTFVAEQEFDRLGVFAYSQEDGTPAAEMPDSVPEEEKAHRLDELMSLQREIALDRNISLIGSIKEVIIDHSVDESWAVGRTRADCPDIDQEVFVDGCNLSPGDMVTVRISAAEGYDLVGSVLGNSE